MPIETIDKMIRGSVFDWCVIDSDDDKFIEHITIYESESREKIKKQVFFVFNCNGDLLEMKTILGNLKD